MKIRDRILDVIFMIFAFSIALVLFDYIKGARTEKIVSSQYIQGRPDTSITKIVVEHQYSKPEPVQTYAPTYAKGEPQKSDDSIRVYNYTQTENGVTIEGKDSVRGVLLSRYLKASVDKMEITRVDTIRETLFQEKARRSVTIFGFASQGDNLSERFGAGAGIVYTGKKRVSTILSRDFINKRTQVGLGVTF